MFWFCRLVIEMQEILNGSNLFIFDLLRPGAVHFSVEAAAAGGLTGLGAAKPEYALHLIYSYCNNVLAEFATFGLIHLFFGAVYQELIAVSMQGIF